MFIKSIKFINKKYSKRNITNLVDEVDCSGRTLENKFCLLDPKLKTRTYITFLAIHVNNNNKQYLGLRSVV